MLDNVLLTVDGSELSEKAIDYAMQIANPAGKIYILNVVDLPDISAYSMYPLSISMDYYNDALTQAEAGSVEYVEKVADKLRRAGFGVETLVSTGIAAETIVDHAKTLKVDAIVMSTHGRSGLNQWLFGSVTQKVLSMMPCPVFVVPGRKLLKEKEKTGEVKAVTED